MAQKQTIADRLLEETPTVTGMAGAEAGDTGSCPRCSGFMVDERYYDLNAGQLFQGVRCINCGEMLDPLIREHQYQQSDANPAAGMSAGTSEA